MRRVGAAGLWRIQADPTQLENAILNLALNARDAMAGGGKLTIETANACFDPRHAAEAEVGSGQYVPISVSDTGHGAGLGLSQVYGFVKQSGGHVRIYSEIGQGAAVSVYLPRLVAEPAEEAPPAAPAEDDDGVRENSALMLKELGYRVVEAAIGARACRSSSPPAMRGMRSSVTAAWIRACIWQPFSYAELAAALKTVLDSSLR